MTGWLALLLHAGLLAVAAPLLDGVVARVAAWRRAERAPALAQPFRDMTRLWRKPSATPAGASALFGLAPPIAVAAACVAGLLTPSFTLGMATAPVADIVVVAALLALSRAVVALAAFDAGSARAAYAGGRVMAMRLGAAPVLLLAALAATLAAGGNNLDVAASVLRDGGAGQRLGGALAAAALAVLAVLEPGAQPAAWSGRALALLRAAGQMRRVAALSMAAALFPLGMAGPGSGAEAWLIGAVVWALKLIAVAAFGAMVAAPRGLLPAAALLALISAVVLGVQGSE